VTGIARNYIEAQRSFVDLFGSLEASDMEKAVPCTPMWTVRDVLSHVAGVTDDIANGRVDGAGTDPWTAVQIERWRAAESSMLIDQWSGQIDGVATLLEQIGEGRPVFDCRTHEYDVRHAVGQVVDDDSDVLDMMSERFQTAPAGRPVTITFLDGSAAQLTGEGEPIELAGISQFEFVRSRLGRRSRDQVAAYEWSRDPGHEVLTSWFVFGPSDVPIVEAASRWG
jgi:hypothetical protein